MGAGSRWEAGLQLALGGAAGLPPPHSLSRSPTLWSPRAGPPPCRPPSPRPLSPPLWSQATPMAPPTPRELRCPHVSIPHVPVFSLIPPDPPPAMEAGPSPHPPPMSPCPHLPPTPDHPMEPGHPSIPGDHPFVLSCPPHPTPRPPPWSRAAWAGSGLLIASDDRSDGSWMPAAASAVSASGGTWSAGVASRSSSASPCTPSWPSSSSTGQ